MQFKNIFIGIPTRDGRVPISSFSNLFASLINLGYKPFILEGKGNFITGARNCIIELFAKYSITENRMLWLDDDIFISNTIPELMDIIKDADDKNINIVGLYRNSNLEIVQFNDKRRITDDDMKYADGNYINLTHSGMGFYYGYTPKDYKFVWNDKGEDVNFFIDNNIKLLLDKRLKLMHQKLMFV